MNLYIYDGCAKGWGQTLMAVARGRGISTELINHAHQVGGGGYGFVRINAHPVIRSRGQMIYNNLRHEYGLKMIQDQDQVDLYDDKIGQYYKWCHLLPETHVFKNLSKALEFISTANFPIISKASVGASSRNVRYIPDYEEAVGHIHQLFGTGVRVDHCSIPRAHSLQRNYVYLQEFIPHDITYRINIIGRQLAVFKRYNYSSVPLAQTGNVEPTYSPEGLEGLIEYAKDVFKILDTKWCAIDVLQKGDTWKLLEASLGWPWPSPGDCNNGIFFPCGCKWSEMFDVLVDEIEAGEWG